MNKNIFLRGLENPIFRSLLMAVIATLGLALVSLALNNPTGNPPTGSGNAIKVATGTPSNTIYINASGYVGISTTTPGYALDVNGSVRAVAFLYLSDERLKHNINPLGGDITSKVMSLRPVSFSWSNSNETQTGLIAQEVAKIFPGYVYTDAYGYQSVDYARLIVPLLHTVQQQQAQINTLRSQINGKNE